MSRIAILGGGSWGTALSIVLARARRKHELSLWVHDPALAEYMARDRENQTYLPGIPLARDVQVTADIREAVAGAQILIGALPTAHAREVYSAAAKHIPHGTILVSASKGLEPKTHKRMSEVIEKALVDLDKGAYIRFSRSRRSWELEDHYRYPGPIQFFGDPEITDAVGNAGVISELDVGERREIHSAQCTTLWSSLRKS